MKFTNILLALAMAGLTACGGGGGSGSYSTGGTYFTHEQLAAEFVRRVNTDVAGYNLSLLKSNTQQYGYIVVEGVYANDPFNAYYDAYYINDWSVGSDLVSYLYNYQNYFYYSLNYIGNNTYQDPVTGTLFEETGISKNLDKNQAAAQKIVNRAVASALMKEYDMNEETATLAAKLSYAMKNNPDLTKQDVENASKQLTGYTFSELETTFNSGNAVAIAEKVGSIEEKTGMDLGDMQKLANDFKSGMTK